MLDQRVLPERERYLTYRDAEGVARAIKDMVVRGAPAIGVAAAIGVALGASRIRTANFDAFLSRFEETCQLIRATRPTAVNLFWAVERMRRLVLDNKGLEVPAIKGLLIQEAKKIQEEDVETNRKLSLTGQEYIKDGQSVLTHCNAGALATAGYGTALGVLRAAKEKGKRVRVIATETRPRMQGARLTTWELLKDGFQVRLITDTMVGHFMRRGEIDLVLVGADRIARNGDVANKIGTYQLAILAKEHEIPFYVAAPLSTVDLSIESGDAIPIEHRDEAEVTHILRSRIPPEGVEVINPAFDITPHKFVTAIITEAGVATEPFEESLKRLVAKI